MLYFEYHQIFSVSATDILCKSIWCGKSYGTSVFGPFYVQSAEVYQE